METGIIETLLVIIIILGGIALVGLLVETPSLSVAAVIVLILTSALALIGLNELNKPKETEQTYTVPITPVQVIDNSEWFKLGRPLYIIMTEDSGYYAREVIPVGEFEVKGTRLTECGIDTFTVKGYYSVSQLGVYYDKN